MPDTRRRAQVRDGAENFSLSGTLSNRRVRKGRCAIIGADSPPPYKKPAPPLPRACRRDRPKSLEEFSAMIRALTHATAAGVFALAALPAAFAAQGDDALEWKFVTGIARPIEMAIVSGDPAQAGPFVVRYRAPSGMKWAPRVYNTAREITVLKGIFWFTPGADYNWRQMDEFKAGSVLKVEADKPYFGWARTAVVIEEKGEGPAVIQYVHEEEDPRMKRKPRGGGGGSE